MNIRQQKSFAMLPTILLGQSAEQRRASDFIKGKNPMFLEILLVYGLSILCPPIMLAGFFIVNPREEMVVLRFGQYKKTIRKQGIHWVNPIGRKMFRIPTRDMTLDIATTTVVERNGNPIQISAVVLYRVENSRKAALDVQNYHRFINDQAGAVVKRVSSTFPYESPEGTEPCLKVENSEVANAYVTDLQAAVDAAGIKVLSVRLNDLTYAPEIAQAMLMRQQALALIDARKTIVEGGVEIVRDAVDQLQAADMELDSAERQQLISNLLVVICSGERAQPVLQVQSGTNANRAA